MASTHRPGVSAGGAVTCAAYLMWTVWYARPYFQEPSGRTFKSLYLVIPGLPWSFILARLDVPGAGGLILMTVSYLVNASLFYWWGTKWTEWFKEHRR